MSLTKVKISEEVWLTGLSHALTTETEEVMGLLLGDVESSSRGGATAVIWGASPQMRCERKKDRVEVNPELLAAASAQAEKMTATIGKTTRVIGWYHSHPHITVLPSHVDVRTQAMFQLLDPGFVGLIFSCFSEDAQKVGKIQVIAFQSQSGQQRTIAPVIDLESSWSSSDNALASQSALVEGIKQDTGDSRASKSSKARGRSPDMDFYSHPDPNHSAKHQPRENTIVAYNRDNTHEASVDPYDSDMTPSVQEALHRSNMDISGAEYVRKGVKLLVFPTRNLLKLETTLTSYCDMQRVLFEEEQSAYSQAMQQNICDGKIHPLTSIHHTSTYNSSLCKLMEYCLSPAITSLQDRLKENELRLSTLQEEAKQLEAETQSMRNDSPLPMMNHGASGSSSPMARNKHPFSNQGNPRSPSSGRWRRAC
ncbi:uncharacterized protein LOC133929329 [Phragmites australis]|uniref:uncharacterized protein LOC133929329 n=1 Tax=Phragmites australis TaxID=29695 RepID=UPI002D77A25B|nr:uncharacterized protein LOC133929329 [Phragmites australis]